jgi:hypothetical protein
MRCGTSMRQGSGFWIGVNGFCRRKGSPGTSLEPVRSASVDEIQTHLICDNVPTLLKSQKEQPGVTKDGPTSAARR